MCFHLMPGYHHVVVDAVRVLLFWCLSHVCAEKKNMKTGAVAVSFV